MLKLISTDFDGTIYQPNEPHPISLELVEMIQNLQDQGVLWVINTGRDLHDLIQILGFLQLEVSPDYIVGVERHIYQRRTHRYESIDDWNTACTMDHAKLFQASRQHVRHLWGRITEKLDAHLYEDEWSPLCAIAGSHEDADLIHQWAKEEFKKVPNLNIVRNAEYFRLAHLNYSKGTALAEIARREKITAREILAVGDHFNDLPMLHEQYAHCVGCPSNAIAEVKETVSKNKGYIANRHCSLGTLDVIRHYLGSTT